MKGIRVKALKTIEGMILATEPTNEMLRACYRFTHVALGACENPHQDWANELEQTYQKLVKEGVI